MYRAERLVFERRRFDTLLEQHECRRLAARTTDIEVAMTSLISKGSGQLGHNRLARGAVLKCPSGEYPPSFVWQDRQRALSRRHPTGRHHALVAVPDRHEAIYTSDQYCPTSHSQRLVQIPHSTRCLPRQRTPSRNRSSMLSSTRVVQTLLSHHHTREIRPLLGQDRSEKNTTKSLLSSRG